MEGIAWLEGVVRDFEEAWLSGVGPSLQEFAGRLPTSGVVRLLQLKELVCLDLEFRWKRWRSDPEAVRRLEEYLREFPELRELSDGLSELIVEEYRARRRWGDRPDPQLYRQRFPGGFAGLIEILQETDRELLQEQAARTPAHQGPGIVSNDVETGELLRYSDYVLHEMIGAGQSGRVYRATAVRDSRPVAVKFLRKSFQRDAAAVQRFLAEGRLVARLHHQFIVSTEGVGATPGGGYFMVTELLKGPDLATIVRAGNVRTRDALRWTIQAANAVEQAHQAGVVHCDLKPANIVLDDHGDAHLTDFGLARSIEGKQLTLDRIAGTAPYMAPEQVSSWWGPVTPRTDVYGLGAVLYTLLTGRPPFAGSTGVDILALVVSAASPAPVQSLRVDLDPLVAEFIGKCLSKRPAERCDAAGQVAATLTDLLQSGRCC